MEYFVLSLFVLCAYFSLRAFSFAMTHISMYNYRAYECIERIVKQQKVCDLLNAVYQVFVMMVSMFFTIECILRFFNVNFVSTFYITCFLAITICFATYFILRVKMEVKYDLCNFYNHMIDYRAKQKVVTEDNDYEVSFIMSYRKTMNHKTKMNLWYVAFLAVQLYVLLQK